MSDDEGLERYHRVFDGYRLERALGRRDGLDRLLATDCALERSVVIHVLAPEAATPERRERFRRVVRLLAQVSHPGVLPVHRGDDGRGGLDYFIVPHLAGETLKQRLARGSLPREEASRLSADLLHALRAVHATGFAGGELDPASLTCVDGRWVLTGLGTARAAEASPYAAPEETSGGPPTPSADLYVAGLLLRDAYGSGGPPRAVRTVLRRALGAPAARWPDAASFLAAMQHATRRTLWRRRPVPVGTAVVAVVLGLGWAVSRDRERGDPIYDLAVLPLVAGTDDPDSLARGLSSLVQLDLEGIPGLRITPQRRVLKLLAGRDRRGALDPVDAVTIRALRAEWVAEGRLERRGTALRVELDLTDRRGHRKPLDPIPGSADDLAAFSDSLALRLLEPVRQVAHYVPRPELQGVPLSALKAFLHGEEAFGRDEHSRAEGYYQDAVRADPDFALAEWRLANVRRWRRVPYDLDLRLLHDRHASGLGVTDRRLLEALIEPDLRRRFAMLESTVADFPEDAYARLIYGEELWHRGPLVGVDVAEARRMMAMAIAEDSTLAQAYDHIIMYHIRQGDSRDAWKAYRQMARVTLRPSPGDPDRRRFFRLALYERFYLRVVMRAAHWWLDFKHDSSDVANLAQVARLGVPWFDIPEAQVGLSRILLRRGPPADSARGSARVGIALGELAQGRVARGLAQLDSAGDALGTAEMRLQQAEWRVIPPALGISGWRGSDAGAWVNRLEQLAGDSALGPRARWALALERLGAGDTAGFVARAATASPAAHPLAVLLRAVGAGVQGHPEAALAISDSVRAAFEVTQPPDPFAGAVFHLFRGAWELALSRPQAADGEWLWYEASDFDGWPSAHPQAGEVDGVIGTFARWRRGDLKLGGAADTAAGCALVRRVAELWQDADSAVGPLRNEIRARAEGCRS